MSLENETLVNLTQAAASFPGRTGGKRLNRATVGRWITRGLPCTGGGRLKLEGVRVGGIWVTSREAIERFHTALTAGRVDSSVRTVVAPAKPTGAINRLIAMGLKIKPTVRTR